MKSIIAGFLAALFLLPACSGRNDNSTREALVEANTESASAALAALVEEYFERSLELNPISATLIGDDRYDDRLANWLSPDYIAQSEALDKEFLERLLTIDESSLDGQDLLTYGTFRLSREMSLEGNQFPSHLQPINQFRSIPNFFVQLGSGASVHPFETVKNYDDFLGRVDDFVEMANQAIENMKIGMQDGVVQPRILMEKVLPQLKSQLSESAEESAFFNPINNMPADFGDADRERLTAAYKLAIEEKIIPAYERLSNFIGDEYLSATRETVGLSDLPDGDAWYAYKVRQMTTTDLSPAEIHQIGRDEVARIHREMSGVMDEVGFEGNLKEFFEFLNTDDQFYYDEPDQLIQGYRDMSDHVSSLAPKLFSVFPKAGFEVRRVEPFREKSASGGSYTEGTPDGSRPGVFYANAYDIKARPIWAMEALFLHEAIPGHHFQISIQQEVEDMPRFRRFGGYTAFSEGWGCMQSRLARSLACTPIRTSILGR